MLQPVLRCGPPIANIVILCLTPETVKFLNEQTTRNKIMCILNTDNAQIMFLDTPGIHKPQHKLGEYMVRSAESTLHEVDVILFVVDVNEKKGAGDDYIIEQLKKVSTKITAFILIAILISACNAVKRVPDGKQLLVKNEIIVNNKKITEENVFNQLYQKPNSKLIGYRLRLNLYNLANLNPDSTYQAKFTNNPKRYEQMSKWLSA